ncbi:hypothetical protein PM10SUCC1_26200 [Propionigenium maris DSM 9537]|uniref:PAS domain S-box-containing protein/diguanylate cyclase (GGDEF) domain-containing protein n=1 Tax=Propionigenium maris DSM 9537 TaxID=1123000 RepID=A0A9W6LN96_9FUSO|nr:diguanylate cyclase [Propionigenium maris]GLI57106.1 hypothetical protein PM10SUCC1_26200 [Propionigenium maris DSM 9537]
MNLIEFINSQGEPLTELLDLLPIPIFYKDRRGVYLGCNKAFERFIKLSREEFIGKTVYELYPKKLADIYFKMDEEHFNNPGVQVYDGEVRSSERESYSVRFHKATFTNEEGEVAGLIGAVLDITKEVEQGRYLEKLASYDVLTGLYNRRKGMILLERAIEDSRYQGEELSIIMMDVDHFKRINDLYGHLYGDEVLKKISQVLEDNLRDQDIVFRYGGEEFICSLPKTSKGEALLVAERIRESIIASFTDHEKNTDRYVTASFGVSTYPEDGMSMDQVVSRADDAMYRIKKNGRNGIGVARRRKG